MSESTEQTAAQKKAAERRADSLRALEEERRGYEARGLADRVKEVDAAIRSAKGEVKGRTSKKPSEG